MSLTHWMTASLEERQAKPHSALVDKHRMHYLKAGSGPDLLLLHGLLGTASCWEPCMERLAHKFSVYAPDAIGIGHSERAIRRNAGIDVAFDSSLEATAKRTAVFMREAGIRHANVVATSHGGAVAVMLAAKYPGLVRSLVLHAPANPYSQLADPLIQFYRTPLGQWFAHRVPGLPRQLQNLALGRMYGNPGLIRDGVLERYIESLAVPGTVEHVLSILHNWPADMRKLELALETLREIPTLLVWGTKDRAVSIESGYQMKKVLKRAEMAVLPEAGHLPHEEMPGAFCEVITGFLRRQEGEDAGRPWGPVLVTA